MTSADAMRLAAKRGLRFELEDDGVCIQGPDDAIDELAEVLRPHRHDIRALLEEYAFYPAPGRAAHLLRYGLWPPTTPQDCNFHVGSPGSDCRRCGATWLFHCEQARHRVTSPPVSPRRLDAKS